MNHWSDDRICNLYSQMAKDGLYKRLSPHLMNHWQQWVAELGIREGMWLREHKTSMC